MRAISRKAGMDAMNEATCHRSQDSNRTCRMSTFSRADAMTECHRRYSRHHCFARMPKRAAARLSTRLVNQSVLIVATLVGGLNAVELGNELAVSLRKGCASEESPGSLSAMKASIWAVVCELSGWRRTRETTRNAVRTAEKRPAYRVCGTLAYRDSSDSFATHEDEESVDVVRVVRDHVFIVAEDLLLNEIPSLELGSIGLQVHVDTLCCKTYYGYAPVSWSPCFSYETLLLPASSFTVLGPPAISLTIFHALDEGESHQSYSD